jgi:1-aminocyclopropane-1-carboxylate deaminase
MPVKTTTLEKAEADGMALHYISRLQYAQKENPEFIRELSRLFGDFYLIPEGGKNIEGVYGCIEILRKEWNYDYVFCACGTGTTYAGLVASANPGTHIIGISPLKGINTLPEQVNNLLHEAFQNRVFSVKATDNDFPGGDHFITSRYAFSGFAAFDKDVIHFKNLFEKEHGITLDYIYTGKLFFGLFQMMQERVIPESSKILVIHTGGLQGNAGFEKRYQLNPSL